MKNQTVKVVQPDVDPISVEILATSIRNIGVAMRRIEATGLTRRGLAVLVSNSSRVPMTTVVKVINAMHELECKFIRKPGKKK